jgi:hypothetical protein
MKNKLSCNQSKARRRTHWRKARGLFCALGWLLTCALPAAGGSDAPQWLHSMANVPLPAHDEKSDAVLLYSETSVTVLSADKIRNHVRKAYKILRPGGRQYGTVHVYFDQRSKVTSLHGWCIPAQGKDYEVNEKDAMEQSPWATPGFELVTDAKRKVLRIPASEPGNIVGYEYEVEEQPLVLQESWDFQEESPVRESRYSLQMPPGWEYKAAWRNHPEVKETPSGVNQWQWVVSDIKGIRDESEMPPWEGVAGKMIVSLFPPGGLSPSNGFSNWREMGNWYLFLTNGRIDASNEIRQEVASLTTSAPTILDKMRAIAQFVQHDVRYVAIELGIGGWQPHRATDVFAHHYGDCKDKATLMRSMLREIGVESYHVVINTERGGVFPDTLAHLAFNHAIVAIKLPESVTDSSLVAVMQHPKLGKILFFDPTDEMTPFGQIRGPLQANYGLLVAPDGGDLVELPTEPAAMNSIQRTAKLILDSNGTLTGEVQEMRLGDRAALERWELHAVTKDSDRIKPIETLLADSLSDFRITKATLINLQRTDQPFGFDYSFVSQNYAKNAGEFLLLRPRVLGTKAQSILETKEPRQFPIEFEGPVRDTDTFEITLPAGYQVEDLSPPADADYSFASYHSKTEMMDNVVRYSRTFEVKELSVPVNRAEDLKKFYRTIASDERNTVVIKLTSK